jgi:hypothetical protein
MNQILTALSPGGSSPAGSPCSALPVELGIAGYRGFVYMSAAFRGVRLDSRGGVHLVDGITRPVFGCKPKSRILQSSVQRALLPHACHKHSNAGEQREREREFVAHVLGLANFDISLPLSSPACPRWLVPFYRLRAGKRRKQHPRTTSFCHACRHVNNNHVSRNANVQALAFQLANQCQPPATRTGHRTGGEQVKSLALATQ